jgi:hypothetical protein
VLVTVCDHHGLPERLGAGEDLGPDRRELVGDAHDVVARDVRGRGLIGEQGRLGLEHQEDALAVVRGRGCTVFVTASPAPTGVVWPGVAK